MFVAWLVAEVRTIWCAFFTGIPETGFGVDVVEAAVVGLIEADVIKKKEFQLRPDVDDVGDAGFLEIGLRFVGHVARVAGVALAGDGIFDITDEYQCRIGGERIHHRRIGIGHQEHVGFVNALKAAD